MVNLEGLSRGDLVDLAEKRGIKGTKAMNMEALRTAIEADAARENAEVEAGQPVEPPHTEDSGPEQGEPLTADQRQKLRAAPDEQVAALLADPSLPVMWRREFQAEADRRAVAAEAAATAARMRSELNKFRITVGGRFVTKQGYVTRLRVGCVVADTTHDLNDLRKQGIQFEPLQGEVKTVEGPLGRPMSRVVKQ